MGIKIDITPNHLKTLQALLNQYLPNTLVWAFGSRVKFTAKPNSDLDLVAFISKAQELKFSLLKDALEESNIPFRIDLHNWNELPETFHKNIENGFVEIQSNKKLELPSEWKTYKLGDLINVKHGFAFKGEYFSDEPTTDILLSPGNFKIGGGFKSDKFKYYKGDFPTDYILKEGDIIITMTDLSKAGDTLGYSANIPPHIGINYLHNQRLGLVQFKNDEIDPKFLYWILRTQPYQYYIVGSATGSTVKHTSPTRICTYEFEAPEDKATQTQIAQILTSLDDKIELNLQINQTLEAMAQAIFKEWFVDFKFPGFDGELVDGLPKGWRMGKVGEEFKLTMGQSPKGETLNQENEGMIFYQGRTDFGFRFPTNRVFTTEPNRIANKLDTLVCVRAPVGDVNIAIEKCCIGRGLSAVMHKSNAYSYTYYAMKNIEPIFKGFESEGTVFGSLNKNNFENIEVVVPTKELIKEFEKVVNPMDEKILNNSIQIQTLTTTRDTLLPKLMSGKIEIKN